MIVSFLFCHGRIREFHFKIQNSNVYAAGLALLNALLVWLRLPETLTAASRSRIRAAGG